MCLLLPQARVILPQIHAQTYLSQDECATEVLAREEIRPAPKQLVRRVLSSLLHALSLRQSDVCLVRLFEGAIDFLRRYGARVFVSSVGDRMQVCTPPPPHSHLLYPLVVDTSCVFFVRSLGGGRCVQRLEATVEERTGVWLEGYNSRLGSIPVDVPNETKQPMKSE